MASIEVFSDTIMPAKLMLAMGARGKQQRRNRRTQSTNGRVKINIDWDRTLRQYEFGFVPLITEHWQRLEGLFEVTEGGAYGFLLEDPKDSIVKTSAGLMQGSITAGLVGSMGSGYGVPTYQLNKRYTVTGSPRTKDRVITRPRQDSVTILRNDAVVAFGGLAGNVLVDYTTGIATFVPDVTDNIVAITTGSTTDIEFSGSSLVSTYSTGERVYLDGIASDVGDVLNDKSWLITGKTGNVLTIDADTQLTTGGGGTGARYPQATESLKWGGNIYVPVNFANDYIDWELARGGPDRNNRLVSGPSVVLTEIPE